MTGIITLVLIFSYTILTKCLIQLGNYEDTDPSDVRVTVKNQTHVYYNAVE